MTASESKLPPAGAVPAALAQIRPEGYFGGARLLAADARVASMLANEARRRAMFRVFGIPVASKSGLATAIALGTLGQAVWRQTQGISPPSPTRFEGLMGLGLIRNSAYGIAGPASRESQYFATLLGLALIGGTTRIAARRSVRGVKSVSHTAWTDFHHRYGHLITPNRSRAGTPGASSGQSGS